ncbi:MAG: CPXCG motif-containing cysteine-rich protein [Acidobacteria bacterium]|nr:CPXCG motif-containing cysteine-rich protein [Acidobacteriota bacterium]
MKVDTDEPTEIRQVSCPYCGEIVEIVLESDLEGEMVWDCEVCCRPWSLILRGQGPSREIVVATLEE